jgi:hypothetical protein
VIAIALSSYINAHFEGNIAAFARWVGLGNVQTHRWVKGRTTPTIDTLLKICFRLEVPLLEFFVQAIATAHLVKETNQYPEHLKVSISSPLNSNPRKDSKRLQQLKAALTEDPPPSLTEIAERLGYKRTTTLYYYASELCHAISAKHVEYQKAIQRKNTQCALEAVIENEAYPPPSLQQVAKLIGIGVYTLKKHFPDLCKIISKRYASYLSECRAQRIQVIREEIRQVATNLDHQGIEPTASRVSPYLKKPRSILQKEAQAALKEVRYKLGWGK